MTWKMNSIGGLELVACHLICAASCFGQAGPDTAREGRQTEGSTAVPTRTVRVTVDATRPQWRISNYLTGMHFVYAFERDSLYGDKRIADWMRRSKVGTIRWPGGTAVQHYHWDDLNGIAFKVDSWDPKYDETPPRPSEYMDLDEYIAYCRRVHAEPMVGVNIRSGKKFKRQADSLEEARRLVQYCKDKGYAVRHWYIGNECFIGWGPAQYARQIDRYAEVIKSVDPNVTIVGDWKFGPEKKNRFKQTLLIARMSKHIDVMEVHEKWGGKWGLAGEMGHHTLEHWQREAGIYAGKLKAFIERFFKAMEDADKDVKLGFNEWGAAMRGDTTPFHVALVKADYLIEMFRHPIYSACDWNLNMGPGKSRILVTQDRGHKLVRFNPAAHVFEMCGHAQGDAHLPMKSTDAVVYGFASKRADGSLQIYLLNKRSEPVSAELDIAGAKLSGAQLTVESFVAPGVIKRT
ncbi:MAG: hypothetical protein QF473_30145, partial [Planctomycetota bacterium]|nr:hypothetical protein [Planctomycetota bacterium]